MLERRVVLPNGRKIAVRESGAVNGRPVFYLHGFLGSRLESVPADPLATEFGLRLILIDRPGFGLSSNAPPDPAIDAADAAAVCSELGLHRPIVVGVSGGSAPALLMAANPAIGAPVVILACPLCPLDDPVVLAQFSPLAQLALRGATLTPRAAGLLLGGPLRQLAKRYPRALLKVLGARFAPADQEALRRGEWSEAIASSLAESFTASGRGALRDLLTYTQRWDEGLWRVQIPVQIWHGRQDTVVPIQCARALARRLANGRIYEYENEGHLSVPLRHMRTLLNEAIRLASNTTAKRPAIH